MPTNGGADIGNSDGSATTAMQTNSWTPMQMLRATLVGVAGIFVSALAWFLLSLPVSAAITLLPAPFDRFSLESVWAIPLALLVILGSAFLATRSFWSFLAICAVGIGLVYASIFHGKYVVDTRWRDTDLYQVSASGDAATMRQMYYDILVRQTRAPPPDRPGQWRDPIYDELKDWLRQQIEAKRPD